MAAQAHCNQRPAQPRHRSCKAPAAGHPGTVWHADNAADAWWTVACTWVTGLSPKRISSLAIAGARVGVTIKVTWECSHARREGCGAAGGAGSFSPPHDGISADRRAVRRCGGVRTVMAGCACHSMGLTPPVVGVIHCPTAGGRGTTGASTCSVSRKAAEHSARQGGAALAASPTSGERNVAPPPVRCSRIGVERSICPARPRSCTGGHPRASARHGPGATEAVAGEGTHAGRCG